MGIAVGLIGPDALGEAVQALVHGVTGSKPQAGWENQLRIAPTIQLGYREGIRIAPARSVAWSLEPFPQLSFTMRTREYTRQEEPHRFGTISLTREW